jgi:hypothetical protein
METRASDASRATNDALRQENIPIPAYIDHSEPYPAIKRYGVLVGLLAPIALVPYLLMRRRTAQLRREIETLKGNIWSMEVHYDRQLGSIRKEMEAYQRVMPVVDHMKHDFDDFQEQVATDMRDLDNKRQLQVSSLAKQIQQNQYVLNYMPRLVTGD